jgi:hypothetical protein
MGHVMLAVRPEELPEWLLVGGAVRCTHVGVLGVQPSRDRSTLRPAPYSRRGIGASSPFGGPRPRSGPRGKEGRDVEDKQAPG